ncbi:ABC transporter ATP-binding protein [Aquabacterium sp. J223]|uniref:ABC transporter ATP-binding protein n=1 Tax=Aquabacterium sp. J223 TaxID=2898431 RepID=UPI0021ADC8FB|nr:ABC transporter ATP-binding protein [Aquabacterium sp. J223]UUX96529.1 ABC transporter ATP-binding protein [Aquabacterium sp. J223]
MSRAEPLLQVRGLHLEAVDGPRRRPLLQDVDLVLRAGEVLGLVGESGAGKSLTGQAVLGLLPNGVRQAAGEIRFDGRRLDGLPPKDWARLRGRHIGAIFQDPLAALNPLQSIGAQLVETLRVHHRLGADAAREEALALLSSVGLSEPAARFGQYPHQFSGGMRQRVVIALALAGRPRLLIADEPTTALDVSVQAQVLALLQGLCRQQGVALLLVSHDMGVIAQMCDRVAVLYAGRVVETGPVASVVGLPAHPYTAALMAAIPTLQGGPVTAIPGRMPAPGDRPPGCAFHPRCPHRFERCVQQVPPLLAAGGAHAACWLHEGGGAAP